MTVKRKFVYSPREAPGNRTLEVGAGEILAVEVFVPGGIRAIDPPVCLRFVDSKHDGSSAYSVVDSTGMPVAPAVWAAAGGWVSATAADPSTLRVVVTGAVGLPNAPFRIAMGAGPSHAYPSLWITESDGAV